MYGLPHTGGLNPVRLLMVLIGLLSIASGWLIKRYATNFGTSNPKD